MKLLLSILIIVSFFISGFIAEDPYVILRKVEEKFNTVKDYEVDINIKVDIDFLKVPETNAKIYFKQPDKIKFHSDGFAIFPKEGLNFTPVSLLKSEYTAIYEKSIEENEKTLDVIKIIPSGLESTVILSTLWIDRSRFLVTKVETTTKQNGTFIMEFEYDKEGNAILPSKMKFIFDITKVPIPRGISGEFDAERKEKEKSMKATKGIVYITYSNYKINKGLDDSLFIDK